MPVTDYEILVDNVINNRNGIFCSQNSLTGQFAFNVAEPFPGGLENPRSSVIGLFRRESLGSEPMSSTESTPQRERRGSTGGSGGRSGATAVILIEDGDTDPLGVLQKQASTVSAPAAPCGGHSSFATIPTLPQPPQTPGQRRQARRGSMLELSGCVDDIHIHMWTKLHTGQRKEFYFLFLFRSLICIWMLGFASVTPARLRSATKSWRPFLTKIRFMFYYLTVTFTISPLLSETQFVIRPRKDDIQNLLRFNSIDKIVTEAPLLEN